MADHGRECGHSLLEFVVAFPVLFLVIWGGFALGIQSLDGMVLKYAVYEEARRAALTDGKPSRLLPAVRLITAWGSGIRGLVVTGITTWQDKTVIVEAKHKEPWVVNRPWKFLGSFRSSFAFGLRRLELASGSNQISYSLPKEFKEMYPRNTLEKLADWLGIPED